MSRAACFVGSCACLAVLLVFATIAFAQVLITEQFADMELSASARCPGEVSPEPDFEKRWLHDLDGINETPSVEMSSDCSFVQMNGLLRVDYGSNFIDATYGSSSALDSLGGGYATFTGFIQLRVDAPTNYTIYSHGAKAEFGDPHFGGQELRFHGADIDHGSNGAVTWDEEWNGTLQPGVVYTISMHTSSSRVSREVVDFIVTQDGNTQQEASFYMVLDGIIVESEAHSWGALKASY